jgi:putative transposase
MNKKFARRPLRLHQIFRADPLYFVTICAYRRLPWLACDKIHFAFVHFGQEAEKKFNIAVGRYVLMPDHAHLFVMGGLDFELGQWVGMLKQALAKAGGRSGRGVRNWQEGCFDHILRSDESYAEKWYYVRENPVRAGLVESSEDWPYQGEIVYIDRI